MTKFNRKVKWTEEWKQRVLDSIESKRKNLCSNSVCRCCHGALQDCTLCPLGDGKHESQDLISEGYCREYYDLTNYSTVIYKSHEHFKELELFLDKMERATERRKVVK